MVHFSALIRHWSKLFLGLWECVADVYFAPCGGGGGPQEEKQRLQHSMQISRQSADSQQASMMPQSMSQGRSQSPHSSEAQQQQKHESSPAQEPQVAQSSTMLHRVRNSQKRQARIQWTQQSSCASVGIWELLLLELLLLLLLLWEVMEGLDCNFLVCLGPAEEDEEVDEPPLGREPSLGCS